MVSYVIAFGALAFCAVAILTIRHLVNEFGDVGI